MAFMEIRLPEGIDYGLTGGETFNTDIIDIFSGQEQRNINWNLPRRKYTVSFTIKAQSDIDELIAFFRMAMGKGNGFRFRDWSDFTAYDQYIATGDGATTTFQLQKAYSFDGNTNYQPILKPVQSGSEIDTTVIMFLNGTPQIEGTDFTVDYTTGLVTFITAPDPAPANGVIITANFEFDIPVRFDTDQMTRKHDYNYQFSWENIPLIELRIPG